MEWLTTMNANSLQLKGSAEPCSGHDIFDAQCPTEVHAPKQQTLSELTHVQHKSFKSEVARLQGFFPKP